MASHTARSASIHAVRRYYEQNTRLFRALGLGNRAHAVHRAVWDEATATFDAALQRVNALALAEVRTLLAEQSVSVLRLLDLGCGLGGTLAYCARALPEARLAGVTLSMTQAQIAQRTLPRARAVVITGDFHHLPFTANFHVALAIESLAHSHDLNRAFEQASAALLPGGRLIVCDDVVVRAPSNAAEERWLTTFRAGWCVPGVQPLDETIAAARRAGFVLRSARDLTGALRLHRLPPFLAGAARDLMRLAGRADLFFHSVSGSLALQECLARGIVAYHLMVFEKPIR
ncbi:class I SAM-dependent methyltransferase [Roseiflexus castenholzii]|uniref:class I SAM-dependent methyltransferase n=1 Tax=Roseiflexus castenholzii TaxID=120962 RepID=UPI003C7DFBB2